MFLNLLIEVILLAILVGGSYYGYKRGLFRMAAGAVKSILCLVISLSLCDWGGVVIIAPLIRTPIRSYLLEFFLERLTYSADSAVEQIPTLLRLAGAAFGVSYDNMTIDTTVESVVNAFTEPLVIMLSRAVAFILLFLLLKYLVKLIIYLADLLLSVGIIGRLNRILGALLSVFVAVAIAWAFTSAVDYLFRLDFLASSKLVRKFDGGPLYRFFMDFSLIRLLLSF